MKTYNQYNESKKEINLIYTIRFNGYSDEIISNANLLDENNIEYDIYNLTENNNNIFIIYAYIKSGTNMLFVEKHKFKYAMQMTQIYIDSSLSEIRRSIKITNYPWKNITKEEVPYISNLNKFNL